MPRFLLFILLLTGAASAPQPLAGAAAGPQEPEGAAAPADPASADAPALTVHLLTMDQGDEVWERFGHNALLIRDEATGEELTWNWGLFDFRDEDFIPRFLRGTMRYSMGPAELEPFLAAYRRANRTVYANEVHLTPEQARELDELVRRNYLPGNRHYTYDYYRDNCSTRVRDALDRVLDGAIAAEFQESRTSRSWRWHSRRLVQGTLWIDQGLSFLLGTRGDRQITEWETMFVPMELMELLEGMEVEGPAGEAGPLLGPREVLHRASRGPTPSTAPTFSFAWLLAGLALGGAAAGLGRTARGGAGAPRIGLGLLGGAWGLVSGALGLLVVFAWFTDHVFIHWNVNVLYASPLALVAAPLLLLAGSRGGWWRRRVGAAGRWIVLLVAALSLLAALMQAVGLVRQGNAEVVALALPMNVGLAAGLVWGGAGHRPRPAPPAAGTRLDASVGAA